MFCIKCILLLKLNILIEVVLVLLFEPTSLLSNIRVIYVICFVITLVNFNNNMVVRCARIAYIILLGSKAEVA